MPKPKSNIRVLKKLLSNCVDWKPDLEIILATCSKDYFLRRAIEFIADELRPKHALSPSGNLEKAVLLLGAALYNDTCGT